MATHPAVAAVREFNRDSDRIEAQIVALSKKHDAGVITMAEMERRAAMVLMTEDQARRLFVDFGVLPEEVVNIAEDLNVTVKVGNMEMEMNDLGRVLSVKVNGHDRASLRDHFNQR